MVSVIEGFHCTCLLEICNSMPRILSPLLILQELGPPVAYSAHCRKFFLVSEQQHTHQVGEDLEFLQLNAVGIY